MKEKIKKLLYNDALKEANLEGIKAYASGSGALSFSFESDYNKITLEDARKFLEIQNEYCGDSYTDFEAMKVRGGIYLVHKIKRIGKNNLIAQFNGELNNFTYKIDKDNADCDWLCDGYLIVEIEDKFLKETINVKNISMRSAIKFYLENEDGILEFLGYTKKEIKKIIPKKQWGYEVKEK